MLRVEPPWVAGCWPGLLHYSTHPMPGQQSYERIVARVVPARLPAMRGVSDEFGCLLRHRFPVFEIDDLVQVGLGTGKGVTHGIQLDRAVRQVGACERRQCAAYERQIESGHAPSHW